MLCRCIMLIFALTLNWTKHKYLSLIATDYHTLKGWMKNGETLKKKEWFDAGRDLYLWKAAYVKSHFWSVLVCHSSGWVFFFLSLLYSLKYIFILLPHTVQLTKQDLNTDGPKHAQKVSFSSAVSDFIAVNYTKISPLSLQGLALKFS